MPWRGQSVVAHSASRDSLQLCILLVGCRCALHPYSWWWKSRSSTAIVREKASTSGLQYCSLGWWWWAFGQEWRALQIGLNLHFLHVCTRSISTRSAHLVFKQAFVGCIHSFIQSQVHSVAHKQPFREYSRYSMNNRVRPGSTMFPPSPFAKSQPIGALIVPHQCSSIPIGCSSAK